MSFLPAVLLACALVAPLAGDEAKSLPSDKEKSFDIGGVVYPADQMDDSESKRKTEIVAEKIRLMEEAARHAVDFSGEPMSEIVGKALITDSNKVWRAAMKELTKRPDEAKTAISNYYEVIDPDFPNRSPSAQLLLTRLPLISGSLGQEFQREIINKSLFHPVAPGYDSVLLSDTGILRFLESSQHDETMVLERLIAQGRLEKGSDLEISWRNRLASARPTRPRPSDKRNSFLQAENGPAHQPASREGHAESNETNWVLVVAGFFVIGTIIILFRSSSHRRAS